jgi:hypothetical protein
MEQPMQQQRRRFTRMDQLEDRLAAEARRLREEAKLLPPGIAREQALRKARQAETGSHISEWLRSPGLQPHEPLRGAFDKFFLLPRAHDRNQDAAFVLALAKAPEIAYDSRKGSARRMSSACSGKFSLVVVPKVRVSR